MRQVAEWTHARTEKVLRASGRTPDGALAKASRRARGNGAGSISYGARSAVGGSYGTRKPVRYHFDGATGSTSST